MSANEAASAKDGASKAAADKSEPFPLSTLRHSVSHLMASAVQKLYPGVKFGFGPAIEHGFYYDLDLPEPLEEKDLRKIEKEMERIAKRTPEMKCEVVSRDEARQIGRASCRERVCRGGGGVAE